MAKSKSKVIYLVASGDLRPTANAVCWPAQRAMEAALGRAIQRLGYRLKRAHPYRPKDKHGFIDSQRLGMDIFARLDPAAPVIVKCRSALISFTSSGFAVSCAGMAVSRMSFGVSAMALPLLMGWVDG